MVSEFLAGRTFMIIACRSDSNHISRLYSILKSALKLQDILVMKNFS